MIEKGTIVQITNKEHNWFPCLIIVDEVKTWGIQGYLVVPTNDSKPNSTAHTRIETADFELVGTAKFHL